MTWLDTVWQAPLKGLLLRIYGIAALNFQTSALRKIFTRVTNLKAGFGNYILLHFSPMCFKPHGFWTWNLHVHQSRFWPRTPNMKPKTEEESGQTKNTLRHQQQKTGRSWLHVLAVFWNRRMSTPRQEGGVPGLVYSASSPPPCGEMQCSLVLRQGEAG